MEEALLRLLPVVLGCTKILNIRPVEGGALNHYFICETDRGALFVKVNSSERAQMFEAEATCLREIEEGQILKVPCFRYCGVEGAHAYLVLDHVSMRPHDETSQKKLGEQLAKVHLTKQEGAFGFPIDNTLGTTLQPNKRTDSWVEFYAKQRIGFQIDLVRKNFDDSAVVDLGKQLIKKISQFFSGITVVPSLLHGDLWYGNTAADEEGEPLVFDPASYYGHHEADLSMMGMFGGFMPSFFTAYHALIPKEKGFERRQELYQLYHYLNHYNLFGFSYRYRCLRLLQSLNQG